MISKIRPTWTFHVLQTDRKQYVAQAEKTIFRLKCIRLSNPTVTSLKFCPEFYILLFLCKATYISKSIKLSWKMPFYSRVIVYWEWGQHQWCVKTQPRVKFKTAWKQFAPYPSCICLSIFLDSYLYFAFPPILHCSNVSFTGRKNSYGVFH